MKNHFHHAHGEGAQLERPYLLELGMWKPIVVRPEEGQVDARPAIECEEKRRVALLAISWRYATRWKLRYQLSPRICCAGIGS